MELIHNERMKLLATALNNSAVATIVTAVIAPTASLLYGLTAIATGWWLAMALVWFLGGLSLHITAHLVLGRLKG